MANGMNPAQLQKRMLLFYFAAGVNLLMALWVGAVGGSSASSGPVTLVTLVFIGFAGLNYYMARKLQKYLKQLSQGQRPVPANDNKVTDSAVADDGVTKNR